MGNKVCVGGFIMNDGKFLFCKRNKKKSWAPRRWDIAGGKSWNYELPFDTLVREINEELAIDVKSAELIKVTAIKEETGGRSFVYHIYMITSYTGKPFNASEEHSKIKWFTREKLATKKLAIPAYLLIIDNWLRLHPNL